MAERNRESGPEGIADFLWFDVIKNPAVTSDADVADRIRNQLRGSVNDQELKKLTEYATNMSRIARNAINAHKRGLRTGDALEKLLERNRKSLNEYVKNLLNRPAPLGPRIPHNAAYQIKTVLSFPTPQTPELPRAYVLKSLGAGYKRKLFEAAFGDVWDANLNPVVKPPATAQAEQQPADKADPDKKPNGGKDKPAKKQRESSDE
jgi:hypothetical protein